MRGRSPTPSTRRSRSPRTACWDWPIRRSCSGSGSAPWRSPVMGGRPRLRSTSCTGLPATRRLRRSSPTSGTTSAFSPSAPTCTECSPGQHAQPLPVPQRHRLSAQRELGRPRPARRGRSRPGRPVDRPVLLPLVAERRRRPRPGCGTDGLRAARASPGRRSPWRGRAVHHPGDRSEHHRPDHLAHPAVRKCRAPGRRPSRARRTSPTSPCPRSTSTCERHGPRAPGQHAFRRPRPAGPLSRSAAGPLPAPRDRLRHPVPRVPVRRSHRASRLHLDVLLRGPLHRLRRGVAFHRGPLRSTV